MPLSNTLCNNRFDEIGSEGSGQRRHGTSDRPCPLLGCCTPIFITIAPILCCVGPQVSGRLLHHMESNDDIQEYAPSARKIHCSRLRRQLAAIRDAAPWTMSIPLARGTSSPHTQMFLSPSLSCMSHAPLCVLL